MSYKDDLNNRYNYNNNDLSRFNDYSGSNYIENLQKAQNALGTFFILDLFSRGFSGKSLFDHVKDFFKR